MNKGFTLIELLVVVLIIGILAAIALPQYTKAVERSRMAEAVQMLGDLATAESIEFMQNNAFFTVAAGETVGGDIQIKVPAASGEWTYEGTAATTANAESATLTATRNHGMYAGGVLSLKVNNEGKIEKICATDAGPGTDNTGFCAVAKAMGYGSGAQGSHTI